MNRGYGPGTADLFERQCRFGIDRVGREARVVEHERQCHREATGMRGGDEFLRVGAFAVTETGRERIRCVLERAALRANRSGAFFDSSLPACGSLALHLFSLGYGTCLLERTV